MFEPNNILTNVCGLPVVFTHRHSYIIVVTIIVSGVMFDKIPSINKRLFALSLLACVIEAAGVLLQGLAMLNKIGVSDVFQALSIPDADKINIALFLTLALATLFFTLVSGSATLRGYTRKGGYTAYAALMISLGVIVSPLILGYPLSASGSAAMLVGAALSFALGYTGLRIRVAEGKAMFLTPVEIAFIAVFSALTAVVTGSTGIMLPSPTGGYTNIGDTVIFIAALLLGSKVGGIVGVIGPVVADLVTGYPRWFVTVFAHGSEGFIAGLGRGRNIVVQAVLLCVSGFLMATTYFVVNVFLKGYPLAIISYFRDLFGQALVSIILGLILTKAVEKALPSIRRK